MRSFSCLLCVGLIAAFVGCGDASEEFVYATSRDGAFAWRDGSIDAASVEAGLGPPDPNDPPDAAVWVDGALFLPDGATYPWMPPEGSVLLEDGGLLLPDGAVLDLATALDLYRDRETDVATCAVAAEDTLEIPDVTFVEASAFDLAPGPTGFGVAHRLETCGKADSLFTGRIEATGDLDVPAPVIDECKQIELVELTWTEDGWWLAWTDNSAGSIELQVQALDEALVPVGERITLTDNMHHEVAPALATVAGRAMIAWADADADGGRRVWTQLLGVPGATPVEVLSVSDGYAPVDLALGQMGMEAAAVGWVDEVAERGIWLQRLDADGIPVGAPLQLTPFAGGGSTVDLATRESDGGAAIYSLVIDSRANDPTIDEGEEIRFRRLDVTGAPSGGEVKIIAGTEEGVGASLTNVGGGYAVSYRTRPQGSAEPEVRLVFVSKEGNVYRDAQGNVITFPLAPASYYGSATKIRLSVDGTLLVGFVDGDATVGNTFKLLRRELNCQ